MQTDVYIENGYLCVKHGEIIIVQFNIENGDAAAFLRKVAQEMQNAPADA